MWMLHQFQQINWACGSGSEFVETGGFYLHFLGYEYSRIDVVHLTIRVVIEHLQRSIAGKTIDHLMLIKPFGSENLKSSGSCWIASAIANKLG